MAYKDVDYSLSTGTPYTQSKLAKLLNLEPIFEDAQLHSFDKYQSVYLNNELSERLITYVFFVRPICNLLNPSGGPNEQCILNPTTKYVYNLTPECIDYISRYSRYSEHEFIPYFTSRVESIQSSDVTLATATMEQPYTGYKLPYAINTFDSLTGGTFDVTFREDKELRITNTHRAWVEYINSVSYGFMCAENRSRAAIDNNEPFSVINGMSNIIGGNIIDYMGSVYTIVCQPDGSEIVWFDKYTGIFPTNIPDSSFSFNRGGNQDNKISITYAYFHHGAMNPEILLYDFNKNAKYGESAVKGDPTENNWHFAQNYNKEIVGAGNGYAGTPHIVVNKTSNGRYNRLHLVFG